MIALIYGLDFFDLIHIIDLEKSLIGDIFATIKNKMSLFSFSPNLIFTHFILTLKIVNKNKQNCVLTYGVKFARVFGQRKLR